MKPRRILAVHDAAQIFDRAVQERALAVLTLQEGQDWATFKARFLERDSGRRYFVLDYQTVNGETLPAIAPGQYVGISFRQRSRKFLFSSVVEAKGHFLLDNQMSIPAIRYRWPDSMTELQRRAYYRTPIPPEMSLLGSVWPGGVTARVQGRGTGLQVTTGNVADLSCGGALLNLHQIPQPMWNADDLLGVELQLPDGRTPIMVDARYRGMRQEERNISCALQFIGLELTVEGRLVLQRLAGCVQRLHRLAMAAGRRDWNTRNTL